MTLNYNGKISTFYRWSFNTLPSNNLCPFFWKLLLALTVSPITWLSYPKNDIGIFKRSGIGMVMLLVFALVGNTVSQWWLGELSEFSYIVTAVVVLVVAMCLLAIIGVGLLLVLIEIVLPSASYTASVIAKRVLNSEPVLLIRERKKSFTEKFCPKIDWKY